MKLEIFFLLSGLAELVTSTFLNSWLQLCQPTDAQIDEWIIKNKNYAQT